MLGSTHGTLTTDSRRARAIACGEHPTQVVHGRPAEAGDLDVSGRPLHADVPDLDRFFRPESVAVVGASDTEGRPNTGITRQLLAWSERVGARLHPVHPTRESVFGIPCAPSVADLPEQVDLAVLLLSDPLPVIDELAEAKVKFAVAFASGFAETGEEGAAAQERLAAAVARADGLRLLGPNTNLNAFERFRDDLDGPAIALITQSGHQGRPVFSLQELGIRLSHWAPTGNEADLETADFISYFAERPEVGAIAAYVEGLKDGRAFLLAADRAARRGVPVVAVKVGRTETGARTAASHTGKLTGADAVVDAAMRQFGVIRVDGLDELQDTATLLARARRPRTPDSATPDSATPGSAAPRPEGVVVYSISGGTGAHFADLATEAGLPLPTLSEAKQAELHQWIPDYLSVANPVDNGGHPVGDWRGPRILDAILDDPAVGVLICPITGPFPPMSDKLAQDLVAAAERTDKLVCVVWGSPVGTEAAYRETLLGSSRVATFRTFANCITAVRAHLDHTRFTSAYRSPFDEAPRSPSPSFRKAKALMRPGQQLSEHAAKQLLRAYGIRVPREQLVTSAAAAVRAASLVGYPVVMKASGARIAHKTELGLVKIGLTSASQIRDAYRELTDIARYEDVSLDGVLVCQMVERGVEMVVGVTHDDLFGPTVTVGLGGVLVEVLRDSAVRVPPFAEDQAHAMLAELRGRALLDGVRGAPPADVDALVEVVLRVQRMALELGDEIAELDINPLMVLPRGQGAVALDALAVCR
ncbi:acetate--CoA ligase family protein [Streptomyces europaeiscabiei]|uniref:Acetate--CoA ligase family protein n=1 Tax=Streptomyces europaeiscabiei TaxID=146819 RepID=A0ABU4NII7_9ACTN|nr:acetate--CoA ligase family protein [Streptomyces europaeiscabiei]MDX2765254.1 acetate--CoA ligase family protein [Streptomyces europaeiscabiei]MDX3544500.1 acetate--CoA ligase family protein [Streptomyces europaeiscabiei]MDX3553849.1 acetate--CoA ligase family protein [Streptomyces europaeiscabiei]MDX3701967.1 acetate--CoA ligase family protein [Streptomyces europaeiscabiei]MDX3833881.1 acetate--CoA ligase family protein [Streptomyces europaeiscabiei]